MSSSSAAATSRSTRPAPRCAPRRPERDAPAPVPLGASSDDDARRAMTTTLDVARAARRAGVLDVTVVALESADEIPADPEEIDEAEREGIRIVYRRGPHRFVGDTHVTGLETIAVTSVFDAEGRFAPTFEPGTEAVIPADTVILAVGQGADVGFLDAGRRPRAHPAGRREGRSRLAAHVRPAHLGGGDVARGPRNLIDAIADGRRAAASIHARADRRARRPRRRTRSASSCAPASGASTATTTRSRASRSRRRRPIAASASARSRPATTSTQARLEGLRCLRCFDNVMLSPELCILCGLCVDVCPPNCITIARADHVGLGTEQQSVLLLDEDLCIRCGLCVNRCPRARCRWSTRGSSRMADVDLEQARARPHLGRPRHHRAHQAQRRVALGVPARAARHTARARAAVVQQRLPARVPGQDPEARAAPALLVPARVHRRGAVRHPARHRRVPDVRLHAVGRLRVRRHAAPEDRRRLRAADPQRAPLGGAPDGARRRAAPRARLLRRRVQEAARVQLGHRRDAAAAHARLLVHRLPAAVGPARVLGGHRRHEPRALRPARRRQAAGPADRRPAGRAEHAAALLRAARRGAPDAARR